MKRTKNVKLRLDREAIKLLTATTLPSVVGGRKGRGESCEEGLCEVTCDAGTTCKSG